ncbi:MAG: mechanosensitive ion channel family protein [Granulosicoccus sp.]
MTVLPMSTRRLPFHSTLPIRYSGRLVVLLLIQLFVIFASTAQATDNDWTGRWNTVWASGAVLLTLSQDGDLISGTYEPGEGKVNAWLDGELLRGRWSQSGAAGQFVFSMARDGQSFAGRYDDDAYWNGKRVPENSATSINYGSSVSPQASLRTVVNGMNASAAGDVASALLWDQLLSYKGGANDARDRNQRREIFWQIIDLSTFNVTDAPTSGAVAQRQQETPETAFMVSPAGSRERYKLVFEKTGDGRWLMLVDTLEQLHRVRQRFLESLGTESYAARLLERAQSPREAMRRFIVATGNWSGSSEEIVVNSLDLSFLPESLQTLEAPLYADYLRQVISRVGDVHWQGIPDNPRQLQPYVHYRHPVGAIEIVPVVNEEGATEWRFSSRTLRQIDSIYDATQGLPLVSRLGDIKPVSEFFRLREWFSQRSPALIKRSVLLENWQWLAIVAVLMLAVAVARIINWLVSYVVSRLLGLTADSLDTNHGMDNVQLQRDIKRLRIPISMAVIGTASFFAVGKLGLPDETAIALGQTTAIAAVIGLGFLALRFVTIVGHHFARQAARTDSYVDEIVASLIMGLVKLMIIVTTFMVMADVVGLPYEGVIAGLGVGGIAIAIAARETVSNFIGAATLLADRPFKRGEVVETAGIRARVLDVGLRSTKLRCHDDTILMVPNALLANEVIINRGIRKRRQIFLTIGLTYNTPREKLDAFVDNLRETWLQQERADKAEHYIGLKNFGASSIDIVFWGYAVVSNRAEQFVAENAFIGDIVDCAKRSGVEFAFPTRTVHMVHEDSGIQVDNI